MARKQLDREYYGDTTRWFVATVIDNSPPFGLEGRVQVRIHGLHSINVNNIPQEDLPWAQVMIPGDQHGGSGFGTSPQIVPGALVFGIFLDGSISQLPLVLGSLPKTELPTSVQYEGRSLDIATSLYDYEYVASMIYGDNYEFYGNLNSINTSGIVDRSDANTGYKVSRCVGFFLKSGYTLMQSVGIVGVLLDVSQLDSKFEDTEVSGIAGWKKNSTRGSNYLKFVKRHYPQVPLDDFASQLTFVLNELQTSKNLASSKLIRATHYKGSANGLWVDGRISGLGSAEIVRQYYLDSFTRENYTSKGISEALSEYALIQAASVNKG